MKQGWEVKKLGEVCEINTGNANTEDAIENGEYAFFDRSKIIKRSSSYLYDCEAIIIAGEGQTFLPKFYSGKFNLHQRAYAIYNFNESVSINYAYKYLIYFHKYFEEVAVGATVKSLRLRHFQDLPIPIPSLPEQQRIVAILDEAFDAIERAKANTERNLQNAKQLFESYLQGVFENKGEGWEEKSLEACFRLKSGDGLTSKMMSDDGDYQVFGGNGIAGLHNEFNLSGNNVIIGRVGALCGNVRHITEKIWLTDNAFKVVDMNYEFDHSFLTYLLNFKNLRNYARQAAQPVISNSSLKDAILNFPKSLKTQQTIVKKLDALSAETKKLEAIYKQKLADLEELKKSILQKAFSGEL